MTDGHASAEPRFLLPVQRDPQAYYEAQLADLVRILRAEGWHKALACVEYALRFHTGRRRDGRTPEFLHQVEQAHYALTIRHLFPDAEEFICAIILHDTYEDYHEHGVSLADIAALAGDAVACAVGDLSNHDGGVPKTKAVYFGRMAANRLAALPKCCDRVHNGYDGPGTLAPEQIAAKLAETIEYILPMNRAARANFPDQADALDNVYGILEQHVRFLGHIVRMSEPAPYGQGSAHGG